MFRIKRPNLRYLEGEEGGAVSSGAEPTETNALGGTAVPQEQPTTSHPWDQHVEAFPKGVQGIARERFGQMEKDFNSRFQTLQQQYSPYKSIVDQKIDPTRLEAAYQFATQFENDPQQFVTYLAQQLGLTFQEAKETVQQAEQQAAEPTGEENPELAALKQQQEQMLELFMAQQQQQEQERLNQQADESIKQEIAEIERVHGKMTEPVLKEVLNRALSMSTVSGQPVSLIDAYNSLESFVSQIQSIPRPGASAPRILPSAGSVPIAPSGKTPGQWSPKETKEAAGAVIARLMAGEQG